MCFISVETVYYYYLQKLPSLCLQYLYIEHLFKNSKIIYVFHTSVLKIENVL